MMNFIKFLVLSTLVAFSASARAQDRPWQLVCFTKAGLESILGKVVNKQQLFRNSLGHTVTEREMSLAACDYAQVPAGSSGKPAGWFSTKKFIFPLFRVQYRTTGQIMYAADNAFETYAWELIGVNEGFVGQGYHGGGRLLDKHNPQFVSYKLLARSCQILDDYLVSTGNFLPDYVIMPNNCRQYTIQ